MLEAAAQGTPAVVVRGDDNAAAELVAEGVNGFVAASADAEELAAAIVRVADAGPACGSRRSPGSGGTRERLSLESSLAAVAEAYAHG